MRQVADFSRNFRRCDVRPPVFDVRLRLCDKPHVAENPRPRIPPRRRWRIFEPHRKLVWLPEFEMLGEVQLKRGVPIGPFADVFAVEPHFRAAHRPVELHVNPLARLRFGQLERLSVPANPDRGQRARAPGALSGFFFAVLDDLHILLVVIHVERLPYRPVVRDLDALPAGGVGGNGLAARDFTPVEEPFPAERNISRPVRKRRRASPPQKKACKTSFSSYAIPNLTDPFSLHPNAPRITSIFIGRRGSAPCKQ